MKIVKLVFLSILLVGIYGYYSIRQENNNQQLFLEDIQAALNSVDLSLSEKNIEQIVIAEVFDAAHERHIAIGADSIDFKLLHSISSNLDTASIKKVNNNQIEQDTVINAPSAAYVSAQVTISYERKIAPFYSKHFETTKVSNKKKIN